MAKLLNLLARGMLPSEIPQPFTSNSYAKAVYANRKALPKEFLWSEKKPNALRGAAYGTHNLARPGGLRRRLAVVNPVRFFNLASEICESWSAIDAHVSKSTLSATTPRFLSGPPRAITGKFGPALRPMLRVQNRATFRYVLHADVQQFYPSVYTHSLAWAMHSKATAKSSTRDFTLLGNRLDLFTRRNQDGESVGLPIGPDTSLVLAEIALSAVDEEVQSALKNPAGFRLIDDYELSFDSLAEAESALGVLQEKLGRFNLLLNTNKTRIVELPDHLNKVWPSHLLKAKLGSRIGDTRLIDYFDTAFELAKDNRTDSVLRFALGRMRHGGIARQAWKIYQVLLCQCMINEPNTIKYVLTELKRYEKMGFEIDDDLFVDAVAKLITKHLPLGHGTEVSWALWLACAMKLQLPESISIAVANSDDPLIPLIAMDAKERKLFSADLDTTAWADLMTEEGLFGESWMVAYEAHIKGWLPSKTGKDHIAKDPAFSFLRSNGVSFYNKRASSLHFPSWPKIDPRTAKAALDLGVDLNNRDEDYLFYGQDFEANDMHDLDAILGEPEGDNDDF